VRRARVIHQFTSSGGDYQVSATVGYSPNALGAMTSPLTDRTFAATLTVRLVNGMSGITVRRRFNCIRGSNDQNLWMVLGGVT
jgi:hypothetical protein